jgi:hypothetical protein
VPRAPARANTGLFVLTGALVLSLLLNLTLAVVLRDAQTESERLSDRVGQLQRELEARSGSASGSDRSLDEIADAVARLRELSFRTTIEPEVLSASALAARVRSLFEQDSPREEVDATQRVLETIGVAEPGTDLWELFVAAHEEQVAGYYDNREKRMVVLGDDIADPSPFTRVILAHELTHALTDQHFNLGRLDRLRKRGEDEATAAFLALIEGDATLLMSLYLSEEMTPDEQLAALVEQDVSSDALDAMPPFLRASLLFPYTDGLVFVRTLYDRGGFAAVDRAYRDPPVSTEQILHPERYLGTSDDPLAVELPPLRPSLGPSWRRLTGGSIGELDVRLMLDLPVRSGGLSARDAAVAAEGWGGGGYVAMGRGERTLVAVMTAWDSPEEASEAAESIERWLPLRYGNRGVRIDEGFRGEEGTGIVVTRSDRVLLLFGPNERSVRDARAALDGF